MDHDVTAISCMSYQQAYVTNKRYKNKDVPWGRPKGLLYGNIPGAGLEQYSNLYGDGACTYWNIKCCIPVGGKLKITGQYAHSRYMSFTIAKPLGNGQYGGGVFLNGRNIIPDPGSLNPFNPNNTRDVEPRNYTVHIEQGNSPDRNIPYNTLYTGTHSETEQIHLSLRIYLVDEDYDGTGVVKLNEEGYGLPIVTLVMLDGTEISGPEILDILRCSKDGDANGYELSQWLEEIQNSDNKISAPCLRIPLFQMFWNNPYSVTGAFYALHPLARVIAYPPSTSGGFLSDPDCNYLSASFSFEFGEVLVIRGKKPSHPRTRRGNLCLPDDPEVQYFSVSTASAPSSGEGWFTACDEMIPVDSKGKYTIVISWPWNRPANATRKNGVVWLNPGNGEGNYVGARNWVGMVYIRYQSQSQDWKERPELIPIPTVEEPIPQDARIMKEYYPKACYMSKVEFEKRF